MGLKDSAVAAYSAAQEKVVEEQLVKQQAEDTKRKAAVTAAEDTARERVARWASGFENAGEPSVTRIDFEDSASGRAIVTYVDFTLDGIEFTAMSVAQSLTVRLQESDERAPHIASLEDLGEALESARKRHNRSRIW